MKISDTIAMARNYVGDDGTLKADSWYITQLNEFFHHIGVDHPESRLREDGKQSDIPSVAAGTDDFPLDPVYEHSAAYFLACQFYSGDSEDTRDRELADKYRKLYENEHVMGGG